MHAKISSIYTEGKLKRHIAFTLAEVLVTLAVVGVIGALTIPGMVRSYEKQVWISGYKETYSIIKQATLMIMADNGGTLVGLWSNNNEMAEAYLPYLKIAKRCQTQTPLGNCFNTTYHNLNGNEESLNGSESVVLVNGSALNFWGGPGQIIIDINGKQGPNVKGKDYHIIDININSIDPVKPFKWDWEYINDHCPSRLNGGTGDSCGVRILRGDYAKNY